MHAQRIESLAPPSCLKELPGYKPSGHEACGGDSSDTEAGRAGEGADESVFVRGYRTNLEAEDPGSGLFVS